MTRVYGINPVLEALKAGHVIRLKVGRRDDARMREVLAIAAAQGVPVLRVDAEQLRRESEGGVHQGIVAEVRAPRAYGVADLVRLAQPAPLLVVLDGVEDPHNVGAILRSVDAAGAHGVVRQTRRAARLDQTVAKASAGALAHVPIADVVNIARAIEELKSLDVWVVGLEADAAQPYDAVDWTLPSAVVLGAEGHGLRRLVRESCDLAARIPMAGRIASLNVSVAAGVVLFEAARQRRARKPDVS